LETLTSTSFHLPGQTGFYKGKVRDVYTIGEDTLVMIATDRISAFDVVLPRGIPYKGQVLNGIAMHFLSLTRDIVPNWLLSSPHPNVSIGLKCEPIKIEMVVRGYLVGHAARVYSGGQRKVCGVSLPEGLHENDRLPHPVITPTTKAEEGHDEDISREDIISRGIVDEGLYKELERLSLTLYERGQKIANERGLILADTKYEFGLRENRVMLMDEIHTPDSSRYFYLEGFEERQKNGDPQKQLSKEFVRKWLIENGFQGKEGQQVPEMDDKWVQTISDRYIELSERVTGDKFRKSSYKNVLPDMEAAILGELSRLSAQKA
jgi:phosphoribosylaminoimidazole-succinocarboxamide synthase